MKKVLFTLVVLLVAVQFINAQCMKTGCVISVHMIQLEPNEGYDIPNLINFLEKELYPAFAKELNCEIKLTKGLNRENKNNLGVIYYYTSKKQFNTFWNEDGSPTEKGQKAIDNINSLRIEFRERGSSTTPIVQDWIIK